MKKLITGICLLLIAGNVFCSNIDVLKKVTNKNFVTINNKVMLADNITVTDYMEFVNAYTKLYGEGSMQSKMAMPNKAMQAQNTDGNQLIVGINYIQATQYCKWLTEDTNRKLQAYNAAHPSENAPKAVLYQLPTDADLRLLDKLSTKEMTNKSGSALSKDKKEIKYTASQADLSFRIIALIR